MIFRYYKLMLGFASIMTACVVSANVTPNVETQVRLSNDNTNRFVCENGLVNDVIVPKHIPHELNTIRESAFFVYKMRRSQDGIEYVTKPHTIHIVCDGKVYTLNVTQANGTGETIRLGDSAAAEIALNAQKLQEMSIEDIMVDMFLDAYNNDLPPNYAVKDESESISVIEGIVAKKRRSIALNGIGLRLVEYTIHSQQSLNLYKTMFLKKEFSKKMRLMGLVPEQVSPDAPARLFIIEDK